MNSEKEIRERDVARIDDTRNRFVQFMCKKCKFYEGKCLKNRNVQDCARRGLKNKD